MKNLIHNLELGKNLKVLLLDLFAIGVVMLLPAISHMLPFPFYYLDPMRLVLFGIYFAHRNSKNVYLLAFGLPIFSMLYSGHPIFYKAILISFELFINLLFLHFLYRKGLNLFLSVFLSILISKVVYYLFKFVFIKVSLISGELFSTNLVIQLVIAIGLSLIFYLFGRPLTEKNNKK